VSHGFSVALLVLALGVSPFYYGGSIGAWSIGVAAAALLLALGLVRWQSLFAGARTQRFAGLTAATALLWLAVTFQFSVSPDTSVTPTWAVATFPLAFLVVSQFTAAQLRWMLAATFTLIASVAALSAARFLLVGERPTLPLIDANNFTTLVYVAWIPAMHAYFTRAGRVPAAMHAAALAIALVFTLALFAAISRGGNLVVAVALAIWVALAAVGRVPWRRVLAVVAIAALAFALAYRHGVGEAAGFDDADAGGGALGVRATMMGVAWQIFLDHPWTGVGVACFRLLYAVMRPGSEQETLGAFVHDDYAQFLAEGGVPLLLALLVLALGAAIACVRALFAAPGSESFLRAGYAMALAAACAHAAINFTFYIAPLAIVLAIVAAALWHVPVAAAEPRRTERVARRGVLAIGWFAWSFFALDNVTYGVFYAEPVPGTAWIRADANRALRYAGIASALNGDRALPFLGAASIRHQQALREPGSVFLRERALADFRRAVAIDPWNPVGYLNMASHVRAFPTLAPRLRDGESEEALLLNALAVDPVNVAAVEALRDFYHRAGAPERWQALLEVAVWPRLESFRRNGEDVLDAYIDELAAAARARGDAKRLADIEQERERLSRLAPVRVRVLGDALRPAR
jgi:O-antigen ligase